MTDIRYTEDHEWVRLDEDIATIGITDHAQEALGDVVFVELPEDGRDVAAMEACAEAGQYKEALAVISPLAGTVVESNQMIVEDPSLVNGDPMGGGWFFKIELDDVEDFEKLMDEAAYKAFLETL